MFGVDTAVALHPVTHRLPSTLQPLVKPAYPVQTPSSGLPSTLTPFVLSAPPKAFNPVSRSPVVLTKPRVTQPAIVDWSLTKPAYSNVSSFVTYAQPGQVIKAKPSLSAVYQGSVKRRQWAMAPKHRHITVPAQTVIQVTLDKTLNSRHTYVGDTVKAIVKDPVYVGPHLAISEGAVIEGEVTDIRAYHLPKGPNPYMVVHFNGLTQAGNSARYPINAELIAYKTGLKKTDYLWTLPQRTNRTKAYLGAAAEGALTGFFANPVFGAPIGAAVWVLAAVTRDNIAHRSVITLKAGDTLPISVQWPFNLAAIEPMPDTHYVAQRTR